MELALQTLGAGYHFFSKLDLKSGFWQFPINVKYRFKTAFITPFGLYEWNVLPQDLRNAPPSFQRIMNKVLSSCIDFSLVYLDDIVIFSRSYHEHLVHLEKVLNALKLHNLTLNSTKCQIVQQTIEYLGYVISSKTITSLPEKIKSVVLFPEPKSLAQANRFIGGLSWYRKFIPQFASIAAPIHTVINLSKSQRYKFKWCDDQSKSFYDLKNALTSRPLMLDFPDDTQPILLSTDASETGLGGILYQEINDIKRILYYHSELLSRSQKRFHPIELEALAIFKCITRMKSFLLGRDIIIFTDNCPLCHMMNKTISNKRVEKFSLLLQEFNITQLIHVQGKHNCQPDYLSRHPISATSTNVSSCSLQQPQSSSDLSSSSTPITTSSSSTIELFDITQLQEHHNNDIRIQKIINDLKHNQHISFELKDGILYKLQSRSHDKIKHKLIYVPSSMINSLFVSYHDNPFIGDHFAILYNTSRQKRPGSLHPVRPPDGANELLGIDFCGPFPLTPTDNK
ncbi:unnamed protein product [Rotaria magnacalcarata]|uniref:Reverse transcriptase domain-containing protein n=1 Tax=Rotaria magnacalcarata TaxID=392030 RepID=A0A816HEZ7_9BILA|nr:unnamed protein product [Rotaria magnacalcarata]